jgi:hypothetical protein
MKLLALLLLLSACAHMPEPESPEIEEARECQKLSEKHIKSDYCDRLFSDAWVDSE